MRYSLLLVSACSALAAFAATPAFARDIMSCVNTVDNNMPPPGMGTPGPGGGMMHMPPPGIDGPPLQQGFDSPPPPPPPPPMMHRIVAPTVTETLECSHEGEKATSKHSIGELTAAGWELKFVIPAPGGVTFYLAK